MIEAAFLGTIVGIIAGLLPGLHTNLLAIFIVFFFEDVWFATVFLIALAVSRSIIDAIPTVFLGASEDIMSLLPGHKLLLDGNGPEAVKFLVAGSLLGLLGAIALIPLFYILFPFLFDIINPILFWLLLAVILILIFKDGWKALLVFTLAGLLGILSLDSLSDPLFPLLSGLFGASGLLISLLDNTEIPIQYDTDMLRLKPKSWFATLTTGVLAGSIVTLFPGLGPSQAAALVQVKNTKPIKFLVITGALGTVDVVISLVTYLTLGKTRNGAVVALDQLLGNLSPSAFIALIATALFAGGIATIITIFTAKGYAELFDYISYKSIAISVIGTLLITSLILSGPLGLLVFITATAIGLIAPLTGVSRSHAMGCLLLPTLLILL